MCLSFLEMCLHIVYLENAFVSHESDGLVVSMILERVMSQSGFHWPHGDKSRQPTFYSVTGEKIKVWCGCQPNYHHGAVEAEVEAEVEPEQLSHKSNKSTWATAKPRTKGKGGGCQWRRTRVRSLLSRVVLLWYLHSICNWWKIQVRQPSPSRPFLISLMFLMHIVFRVFLYKYFSCFLWWVVALCVSDSCGGFLCSDNIRCVVLMCFSICSSWLKPGSYIKFTEELSSMLFR